MTALINLDSQAIATILEDLGSFEKLHQVDASGCEELLINVAKQTQDFLGQSKSAHPWGSYLSIDEASRKIVGICSFKGAPTDDGIVEIAYFTFPQHEGRGYATGMAKELITMACSHPEIYKVIAHTLPEKNASNHILEKLGMRFAGEVTDPVDGKVWRWEYPHQR